MQKTNPSAFVRSAGNDAIEPLADDMNVLQSERFARADRRGGVMRIVRILDRSGDRLQAGGQRGLDARDAIRSGAAESLREDVLSRSVEPLHPNVVLRSLWVLLRGERYRSRYAPPPPPDRDATIARVEAAA